ncbi:type II toxin-antitoxin system HipA family toxin [Geoalkalibacter halelectricus]|uniref:Type II toxin-antitoxin system HipA family toxin n=1 Tax=Geoalkalibacter halelectricus TaxID=2847045 RepID=A0ABY5ZPQ4_9BACT|nr:type II toxin-antitoxin system HipA family toxin [Geoalkalibacter halelectricus]MDO3377561.1 type II toxin-antitoxin system HipA family toxin [Geoalkalibacter halelectricus]UWZ80681.1 type II toxin-antitoxin system HipA family toxin [Geoalkalibacter halelectricus]
MSRQLLVKIDEWVVGRLWLDAKKLFCFQYDDLWLEKSRLPLSLSLPLRKEPYLDDESHPFFANLLPEEKLRTLIARNLGISPNNDYGLLERIGGDCAGAVSLFPDGTVSQFDTGSYRRLSLDELNDLIGELPRRPLLAGEKGLRLSLAGAQKKLPVYYDEQHFHLGMGSAPSNYIIKPPIDDLDGTVENEAFCMALAREVGLDVPKTFIHQHGPVKVFVIARYDRIRKGSDIKRLHQEDFCQAFRVPPEFKYETEGGPSLAACFDLARKHSIRPGKDILSLLNWVIFNYLIGNSDAHGKNLSLLLLPEGPKLSPFYDLLSTRIYSHYGLDARLAMKIGGEGDPDGIKETHWEQFAIDIGVKPGLVLSRAKALAGKVREKSLQLFKGPFAPHRCDALDRLMERIGEQADKIRRRIS